MNVMIAFVTKGQALRPALEYDFSHCKVTGRARAEYICGTLCGTPRQMSKQAAPLRALRDVTNPIWRVSLNLDTRDGVLPREKWDEISNDFLTSMGLNPEMAAWCSIRHSDHHDDPTPRDGVHISILRVQPDGTLFNIENDVFRAIKVTKWLEEKHGLNSHNREPAERRAPTVAQTSAKKRTGNMTAKETIQNKVDAFFKSETELTFENLQQKLLEKGVEIRDAKTQKGRLQGFSYFDQKSGVAVPGSKLGTDYSLGMLARGLKYDQKEEQEEQKPASKMPAMLKPLILPEQYGAKELTHAAHQTEVTLNSEKFNTEIVNLQAGPAAKAMLIIGGLLAQASVFLIQKILAFLKRLLAFFGFGLRASDLQKYQHPDKAAPALCYEPTQLALPAPKSAEDKCSDELFRIAQSLETNDPSLLPILDDEEASKARAEVVAAMENQDDQGAGVTTSDAENFGFTDDDFASTNPVAEPPKPDPLDDLKEALAAHEVAARELKIAEIKNGPIHFSTVVQRQAELKIVREDVESARAKWDQFCTEHPFKSSLPSSEKKRLQDSVKANEEVEKRAKKAVATAEAVDARIAKLYAALPAAVVPPAILQSEFQARQAVKTAREAIQIEALAAIKAIRSDIMMSPKMAKFESLFESSFKQFNRTGEISADEISVLASQISELRRLQNAQEAARRAALAVYDEDADQPVIDGQIVK